MITERDLEALKSRLLDRQQELETLSAHSNEARATVELDQSSVGRVSRIDAIQQQAMALATERNRERDLQRIKSALLRMDKDVYGYCITCGEDISYKRLQSDPAVPTCIACAS